MVKHSVAVDHKIKLTLVFRATIKLQNSDVTAADVVNELNLSVQSGQIIISNGITLDVDPSCPATLQSLNEDDCFSNTTAIHQQTTGETSITIIVLVQVIVLLLIIVVVAVIVVVYLLYKRKRHEQQSKRYAYMFVCNAITV